MGCIHVVARSGMVELVKKRVLMTYTCSSMYNCSVEISLDEWTEELVAIGWGYVNGKMPGFLAGDGREHYFIRITPENDDLVMYVYRLDSTSDSFDVWQTIDEPLSNIIRKEILLRIETNVLGGLE